MGKSSVIAALEDLQLEEVGVGKALKKVREPEEVPGNHVVEFRDVTKTYNAGHSNAFTAIKDVTFAVEDLTDAGEFVCILGPSGCGKSTILRLIAGLEPQHPPTIGDVLVHDEPVLTPGADRGMVFQDYTSFDHRTVLDNVAFGLECRGMRRKDRYELSREWIEKVGLHVKDDQYKYPRELSGGMRQRVAIARTLALRPSIILMDEPFGALDPETRMSMQHLLVDLWREVQATIFFVTHSLEEAVYLGDRVYILSASPGTILQELVVEPPDRPAWEMRRESNFQETVHYIGEFIRAESKRAEEAKAALERAAAEKKAAAERAEAEKEAEEERRVEEEREAKEERKAEKKRKAEAERAAKAIGKAEEERREEEERRAKEERNAEKKRKAEAERKAKERKKAEKESGEEEQNGDPK